ncbi:YfhO family protein, partial [bacterium]|nr:YfhO family protein [bacterium]
PYYMDKIKYIMLVFKNNFYLFLISHIAKIAGLILCYIIITKRKPLAKPIFYFLTVCVFIDLLAVSQQYMEFMPRQDYYPQKKSLSFLQEKSKKDIFRVGVLLEDATWFFKNNPNASFAEYNNFLNSDNQKLHENIIIYYGLQAISSQSGLYPQRQYDYFRLHKKNMDYGLSPQGVRFTNLESTLLNLVNMKYIITPAELSYKHYKKVFSDEKYIVYENLNAFPRAFWVPEAKYIAKKDNLFSLLSSDKVDFTKTVLISENQPPARLLISAENDNANGNIKIKQYSPNKIIIQSDYNQDGWLVLADAYYPGWSAYIGDVKTNIYPANHLLRTVFVPAGTKTITFRYFSNYMLVGIWISSFSWCAAGLILLFCAKKK